MKKLIVAATAALFVFGCSDDDDKNDFIDNVQEGLEDRDIQDKNFKSACTTTPLDAILTGILTGGDAAIKAQIVQYRFEGDDVTRTTYLYSEADCTSDVAIIFREVGQFNVDTDRKSADGGKFIDIDYTNLLAQTVSTAGVEVANSISLCGAADWAPGAAERDVTPASADIACYSAQVPRHNSNIYRYDAGTLVFGAQTKANNDDASRPTVLDGSVVYTAQ